MKEIKEAEIDYDDTLKFPSNLSVKKLNNEFLLLFYNLPNWIILNNLEYNIFQSLLKNKIAK